ERIALVQRMPGPGQADGLVGIARRIHRVDLGVERVPVIGQAKERTGTGAVLFGREHGRRAAVNRRGLVDVVALVAVHNTAVPGAVIVRRPRAGSGVPGAVVVLAGGLCRVTRPRTNLSGCTGARAREAGAAPVAGAVGGVPIAPVDPLLGDDGVAIFD